MSKKKVIILSVVLILAIAYISRVAYVNIVQAPIKVERYSMGDTVKHCNYQFRVTDYRIYYRNEFEKKYGSFGSKLAEEEAKKHPHRRSSRSRSPTCSNSCPARPDAVCSAAPVRISTRRRHATFRLPDSSARGAGRP